MEAYILYGHNGFYTVCCRQTWPASEFLQIILLQCPLDVTKGQTGLLNFVKPAKDTIHYCDDQAHILVEMVRLFYPSPNICTSRLKE